MKWPAQDHMARLVAELSWAKDPASGLLQFQCSFTCCFRRLKASPTPSRSTFLQTEQITDEVEGYGHFGLPSSTIQHPVRDGISILIWLLGFLDPLATGQFPLILVVHLHQPYLIILNTCLGLAVSAWLLSSSSSFSNWRNLLESLCPSTIWGKPPFTEKTQTLDFLFPLIY